MVKIKTLLDLLGTLIALLSLASVVTYLDRPVIGVVLLALVLGLWSDRTGRYVLPAWLGTLLALGSIAAYAVQITRAEVATPVVHALVLLLSVRLLSPKQGRDYLQIFVLALFILAGSSLLNLEVSFIAYLVLLFFCVTIGLVLLTVFVTDQRLVLPHGDLAKLLKVALVLPVVSLILMLVFFVILPRTRSPLWNFLNPTGEAVVGLAETIQPGTFSKLSTTKTLAFRAEVTELAPEDRYWRALVINHPEERRWSRVEPPHDGAVRVEGPRPLTVVIYPEPRTDRYLVTLDRPTLVSGIRHEQDSDQTFRSRRKLDQRLRYEVDASPGAELYVAGRPNRDFYLSPPLAVSEKVQAVAASVAASAPDTTGRLQALAGFFREQGLSYAEDDLSGGNDPIDDFLFQKKRGYCEFFASAYVTLARLAGIPARMVGGYYGGEYNPLGGYYLVYEETAHVWVEFLSDTNRWQRVDPSQWAINAESRLTAQRVSALSTFSQLTDSLNYYWVQAVVVFDLGSQLELFRDVNNRLRGMQAPGMPRPGTLWLVSAGGATALLVWVALRRRRQSTEDRLLKAYRARVARRYGAACLTTATGLTELAERLDNPQCHEFARIYQQAVFHDRRLNAEEVQRLEELLREL